MSLQAMSVSFDRVLSASIETLSPSTRNVLLQLASTPQAEKDRQGLAELSTHLNDDGGLRLGESLREIGTVLEELLGMSPDTPSQSVLVANPDDGFAGYEDPSLPPEHMSRMLSGGVDLTDDMTPYEQDDLTDLNAIGQTVLPFDVHEAHSHDSKGWQTLSNQRVPPTGFTSPPLAEEMLGTSPLANDYFLRFGADSLADSDLLAAEMLPKPEPTDADSAYHSSPSSPGSGKPAGARKQPSRGSFAPEDSKRRKSSPKATQPTRGITATSSPRRPSSECSVPFEANSEVKTTGQYRGMSQRDAHNAMERERRIQLRENFECLRSEVPALRDADKAATLQILREATAYIQRMRDEEKRLVEEKAQLLSLNESLRQNATLLHDDGDSDVPPLLAPPSSC
eukprot:m.71912 g.71912  ORF g.71912 m.71912 type:complete len:397 (+) comp14228_c0_seq1:246-1436(+)